MPHPNRRDLPFAKLSHALQRVLRWLDACTVLQRNDLISVAWQVEPQLRQARHALRGWTTDGFIAECDHPSTTNGQANAPWNMGGPIYRLGPRGSGRLREVGITPHPTTDDPASRVRDGLLLASAFAVGLTRDLATDPSMTHFTWNSTPFQGDIVRADGEGVLCYHAYPQHSTSSREPNAMGQNIWNLSLPENAPAPGQLRVALILEVDSGSESSAQLATRAAHWRTVLRMRRAALPPGCWLQVLWVTEGSWERADTIWRAWITHARFPLFITTVSTLTFNGMLRHWLALWRDEHGRPRSLNPHRSQEPIWRPQASAAPLATTLSQAIAAWEATQRV